MDAIASFSSSSGLASISLGLKSGISLQHRNGGAQSQSLRCPFLWRECANLKTIGYEERSSSKRGQWRAMTGRDIGEMGAREPFPQELESNFGDKVLGNADTEHRILMPRGLTEITGLASRKCSPLPAGAQPLSEAEAREYLKRIVGWKLVTKEVDGKSGLRLRGEWKLKNFKGALELMQRIGAVAEEAGHHPDIHIEGWNKGRVDIWSHSVGGVTENDFILAAKIDNININDLIPRKRFWA